MRYVYDTAFVPWLMNNIQNNVPLMCLTARLTDAPYKSDLAIVIAMNSYEFSRNSIYTICAGNNGIEFKTFSLAI